MASVFTIEDFMAKVSSHRGLARVNRYIVEINFGTPL